MDAHQVGDALTAGRRTVTRHLRARLAEPEEIAPIHAAARSFHDGAFLMGRGWIRASESPT
jgi:hypothetical protein